MLVRPVSALFDVAAPPSATNALVLPTISSPPLAIVPICPPEPYSSSEGPNSSIAVDNVAGATAEVAISSAAPVPSPNRSPNRVIVPLSTSWPALTTVALAVSSKMFSVPALTSVPATLTVPPPARPAPPTSSVLLLTRFPATLSWLPAALFSVSTFSVPPELTVSVPLSATDAPDCSSKSPPERMLVRPVSALFDVAAPPSATNALVLPTISSPPLAIVPICPPEPYSSSEGPNSSIAVDNVAGATAEVAISSAAPVPSPNRSPNRVILPLSTSWPALTTVAFAVSSKMFKVPALTSVPATLTVPPPARPAPPTSSVLLLTRFPATLSWLPAALFSVSAFSVPVLARVPAT